MSKNLDMYRIWFKDTLKTSSKKGLQDLMGNLNESLNTLRNEVFTLIKTESK